MDHFAGQVGNAHRCAHVEHIDLAAFAHGTGLQHQLRGFGDGHEVAGDVGMGECDRPALGNLLAKQGHHRARRPQHVAKPHHGETGANRRTVLMGQGLQHHFAQTLAGPHDIGGPHRLVGADQHKVGHPCFQRSLGAGPRAPHVVVQALGDVVLDQRYVLVGRGVVHGVWPPGLHDAIHAAGVCHRAQQGHAPHVGVGLLQFVVDLVERVFAAVEQQQGVRLQGCNLAHQLAADRAARPGDEHGAPLHQTPQQVETGGHGVAAHEFFDVKVLHIGQGQLAGGQPIKVGQCAHPYTVGAQHFDQSGPLSLGHRGHGQHDLVHMVPGQQLLDVGRRVHRLTVDEAVLEPGVVIQKTHQPVAVPCTHRRSQHAARIARTVNEQAWQLAPPQNGTVQVAQQQPHHEPRDGHVTEHEDGLQDAHGAWHRRDTVHGVHGRKQHAVDRTCPAESDHGTPACMPKNSRIQAHGAVHHHTGEHRKPQGQLQWLAERHPFFQAQVQRQHEREVTTECIHPHRQQPFGWPWQVEQPAHKNLVQHERPEICHEQQPSLFEPPTGPQMSGGRHFWHILFPASPFTHLLPPAGPLSIRTQHSHWVCFVKNTHCKLPTNRSYRAAYLGQRQGSAAEMTVCVAQLLLGTALLALSDFLEEAGCTGRSIAAYTRDGAAA